MRGSCRIILERTLFRQRTVAWLAMWGIGFAGSMPGFRSVFVAHRRCHRASATFAAPIGTRLADSDAGIVIVHVQVFLRSRLRSTICRRSSIVAVGQRVISSMWRPQPRQMRSCGSSWQCPVQGDAAEKRSDDDIGSGGVKGDTLSTPFIQSSSVGVSQGTPRGLRDLRGWSGRRRRAVRRLQQGPVRSGAARRPSAWPCIPPSPKGCS